MTKNSHLSWRKGSSILHKLNRDFRSNRTFEVEDLAVAGRPLVRLQRARQQSERVLTVNGVLSVAGASCHQQHGSCHCNKSPPVIIFSTNAAWSSSFTWCEDLRYHVFGLPTAWPEKRIYIKSLDSRKKWIIIFVGIHGGQYLFESLWDIHANT